LAADLDMQFGFMKGKVL